MNPSPAPTVNRARKESPWLWIPVVAVVLFPVMLVAGVASYFHSSSDTKALRNALSSTCGLEKQVAVNVGSLTMGSLRTGLSFLGLDADARAALGTVRGIEIGLYHVTGDKADRAAMLASTDAAMHERGWYRVVGAIEDSNLIAIYVPEKISRFGRLQCCGLATDGREIIIAAIRADVKPLLERLLQQPDLYAKMQLLVER